MQKKLYIILFVLFLTVVAAQLRIITEKPVISAYSEIAAQGRLETGVGTAELTLYGIKPSKDIIILINGIPSALFTSEKISLSVADGSLVEVDGRRVGKPFSVEITGISKGFNLARGKKFAYVSGDIKPLASINAE